MAEASPKESVDQDPPPGSGTLTERLAAANVNPETYLATDYLNHFNQVAMVLEMAATSPEMLDDAQDWEPKTYRQHFLDSGFTETDLIVWAYENAPADVRAQFENETAVLDGYVLEALALAQQGDQGDGGMALSTQVQQIYEQISKVYGIINGRATMHQDTVDDSFGDTFSQDDIDSLFD